MRRLTLTVTPEQAGRTVKSLLRRELRMADGAIARVKTVPDGICLNGAHARTVDRVAAGDTLTVRIDDKRSGGRFTPVAVPLDILYEDADLLALNKPAGMAVHGGYDRGDPTVANALAAYLGPDAVFTPSTGSTAARPASCSSPAAAMCTTGCAACCTPTASGARISPSPAVLACR